jgi:hypothetical protein
MKSNLRINKEASSKIPKIYQYNTTAGLQFSFTQE